MQTSTISIQSALTNPLNKSTPISGICRPVSVTGMRQKFIQKIIWLNILIISIKYQHSFIKGLREANKLKRLRNKYRNNLTLTKYQRIGKRYYHSYNAPGWPSPAFDRYIEHSIVKQSEEREVSLHTLIFAITKKCGFRCEHCCEWENLNKPEQLGREDLLSIIQRFHDLGISQLQLSGGEPLNRFDDILFILDQLPNGIDCWMYTTGYQLSFEKAKILKDHGLCGISISIDDHDAAKHDKFRGKAGSFHRAIKACHYATAAGLVVTFSICATKDFISEDNLMAYALLAKSHGASFIQILEPKAVGHYANMDVTLKSDQHKMLETFYEKMNFDQAYSSFPTIVYHGYYSRRIGCAGSGNDYLYVDTDGDVHNCPFCQRKLFNALEDGLIENIENMRKSGCGLYKQASSIARVYDHPLIKTI